MGLQLHDMDLPTHEYFPAWYDKWRVDIPQLTTEHYTCMPETLPQGHQLSISWTGELGFAERLGQKPRPESYCVTKSFSL